MSTWVEGRKYNYYGTPLVCVRRFFVGPLEYVELSVPAEGYGEGVSFIRTARTLAPCVTPAVTETLGGVLRPECCDHRYSARLTASAGPHAGKLCCSNCGGPTSPTAAPDTTEGPTPTPTASGADAAPMPVVGRARERVASEANKTRKAPEHREAPRAWGAVGAEWSY